MSLTKRALIFAQIGIFLLGISGSFYTALTPANSMMNWYSSDDAFFYYQVGRNAVEGHGFTFDQINLTNGYHPLWMLVCLGVFSLARFHLLLPLRVLILVSGLLNGLTGVILFRLLRRHLHPYAAILGALVWMLLPTIFDNYTTKGLESGLSAFFIALLLLKSIPLLETGSNPKKRDYLFLGILSALTILSRLDNIFVVGMIGAFIVFRIKRIRRLVIYDLVAILIMSVLAWIIRFGTNPTILNSYSIYPLMLTSMALIPATLYFAGLYSHRIYKRKLFFILRLAIASVIASGLIYSVLMLLRVVGFNLLISRSLILIVVGFSFAGIALIRFLFRLKTENCHATPWQSFTGWINTEIPAIFKNGVLYSLPIALLVGGYMLINKRFFGTYSPISGQIKNWWGTLENTIYKQNDTLLSLLGLTPGSGNSPWSLLTTIIADIAIFLRNLFKNDSQDFPMRLFLALLFVFFILMVYLLSKRDGYLARKSFSLLIPSLTIGCFLHISYYAARGYGHIRSWYWVPESMLLVLLGAVVSSIIFEKLRQLTRRNTLNITLLFAAAGLLMFLHTRYLYHQFPYSIPAEKEIEYIVQVRSLEQETPEGALIGMTGGGETAYFIQNRTIVNLDGLISSVAYFEAMKNGTADEFLERMGLDYVFGKPYTLLESNPYQTFLKNRLRELKSIDGPDHFVLYDFLSNK